MHFRSCGGAGVPPAIGREPAPGSVAASRKGGLDAHPTFLIGPVPSEAVYVGVALTMRMMPDAPAHALPLAATLGLLREGIDTGLHRGAQVCVWRGGVAVADMAVGEARPEVAMTPEHVLLWHSAGKPMTAVAVMQLVERGELDLADRVAEVLPEFGRGGKEAVTLQHILIHTGGFRGLTIAAPSGMTQDEAWGTICDLPIEEGWEPGRSAGYHPLTSWFVLGRLIEAVTGERFAAVVRERVLEPLGMGDAWVGMPPEVCSAYEESGRLATTWNTSHGPPREPRDGTCDTLTAMNPGGGACGRASDLARFYEAMRRGGEIDGARVLQPETVAEMTRPHRVGMMDQTFRYPMPWGLGFILQPKQPAGRMPYGYGPRAGRGTFGHGGVQSVAGFCDPEHELSVGLIYTGMPGERRHQERVHAVLGALYQDLGVGR